MWEILISLSVYGILTPSNSKFLELQAPPTRTKSLWLGRRKSCNDSVGLDKGMGTYEWGTRHNLEVNNEIDIFGSRNMKDCMNIQNANNEANHIGEANES